MKLFSKFYNQGEGGGGGGFAAPAGPGPGAGESIGMHSPSPQPAQSAPSGVPQPQFGGQGQGQYQPQSQPSQPQFQGFDYDRFAQAQARALQQFNRPQAPSKPASPFGENPSKYWFIPDAEGVDGGREFHQRFEQGVNYMMEQALNPIRSELAQARQALSYVNALKSTDPALAAAEQEFTHLVDQGVPVQFAREHVLLKHRQTQAQQAPQNGYPSQPFAQPQGGSPGFSQGGPQEFGAAFVQAASQRPPAMPVAQVPPHAMQGGGRQAPPGAGPRFDPQQKPDMTRIMSDLLRNAGYQV